ncbi:alpha/beta hydrolase [Niveispirillum fermenti]|uniref:alpha/beta hydrolase n=1 Tax=Niveispirillum fermenti TaxID=1233113 RepID=UPI003A8699B6
MTMPLDPDARRLLDMAAAAGAPSLDAMGVVAARAAVAAMGPMLAPPAPPHALRHLVLDGPGGPLPARLYRPEGVDADIPLPALVHLHGGGWVLGDLDGCHSFCATIASRAGIAILSVDYRLAPEHPFPAALADTLAAVRQAVTLAADLGIDPSRLAIGGDSAGGNLAAVTCLTLRDGGGPDLRMQVLLYPVTDLRMRSASYALPDGDGMLTGSMMRWFRNLYAGPGADVTDQHLSPLLADDHAALPPAYVLTCGFDPLCDEGRAYADALAAAGVPVTHVHCADQMHGFLFMGGAIAAAGPAVEAVADHLRTALAG